MKRFGKPPLHPNTINSKSMPALPSRNRPVVRAKVMSALWEQIQIGEWANRMGKIMQQASYDDDSSVEK